MNYWKHKLAAYLHDPPSKFADIGLHEEHARTLFRQAGFEDEEEIRRLSDTYAKPSDWVASAADRFPFPKARSLSSVFDGERAKFRHPLASKDPLELGFHKAFVTAEAAMEVDSVIQPRADVKDWEPEDKWKARFFAHWRLWEKFCSGKDYRFASLPADTRIPDHTIWNHMQVVSALDGCSQGTGKDAIVSPAFLKFQLGPVQEFIAEARSTRDLWSGSYLLSWLMAAGLKALALEVGPDAVIFPNLKEQALFDLLLKDDLFTQIRVNGKSIWDQIGYDDRVPGDENAPRMPDYLTPNLPNVFLAVVPAGRANELAERVQDAICGEWNEIADTVWKHCEDAGMVPDDEAGFSAGERRARFDLQVRNHHSISWQATPWPKNVSEAVEISKSFFEEYDLCLMAVATPADLTNTGESLVIVALVDSATHIRIFDSGGQMVIDKPESELAGLQDLTRLTKLLNDSPFPVASELTEEVRCNIIEKARLVSGHTLMPIGQAAKGVECIIKYATEVMPETDRDWRYYVGGKNGPKKELNSSGLGWSILVALNSWQLDAVRQTRHFRARSAGQFDTGVFCNKDSLGGRDEAVAGGREWYEAAQEKKEHWKSLFKHSDWIGAVSLIKRLWPVAYLAESKGLPTTLREFRMPNTHGIARHDPFSSGEDDTNEREPDKKYYAILAFDGDNIGEWVSGNKTPPLANQFSSYFDHDKKAEQGAIKYFKDHNGTGLVGTRRPLSPSYHLQFSQALSNFAQLCARPIVEVFDGRLIYAGGDDVLAMLPADTALSCAKALRLAFQGSPALAEFMQSEAKALIKRNSNQARCHFQELAGQCSLLGVAPHTGEQGGFLVRLDDQDARRDQRRFTDQNGHSIPFIVPGPAADASVGIAIAHFKAPLQDIVREAQAAEKRAKQKIQSGGLGRAAVAITLLKRSGEIEHWGCKWDEGGLAAFEMLLEAMKNGVLSAKFPHRVIEYLEPLRAGMETDHSPPVGCVNAADGFDKETCLDVVFRYLELAADKQAGINPSKARMEKIVLALKAYGTSLKTSNALIQSMIGLMTTVAFAARTLPSGTQSANNKGTQS